MIPIDKNFPSSYVDGYSDSIVDYVDNRSTKYVLTDINRTIATHLGGLVTNLKELICAPPDLLDKIKSHIDGSTTSKDALKSDCDLELLYDVFKKGKKKNQFLHDGVYYCSSNHFKQLGVTICPYCNQNPTTSFEKKSSGEIKRSFDWDHLYPKSEYPLLSVAIYNLIPSCKVCNQIKKDGTAEYLNPFHQYSVNDLITFDIEPNNSYYWHSADYFDVVKDITPNDEGLKLESLLDETALLERYNEVKAISLLALNKKRTYNRSFFRLYGRMYDTFVSNGMSFRELFFQVASEEQNYGKMPYSKLINDLLDSKR